MNRQCDQFLKAMLTFVRGMFWHDIAKPLYLGNEKHTAVGYTFLSALGCPGEALVALSHANAGKMLEKVYHPHHPFADHSLPSYLALTSALDVLSSVTYSLEETEETKLPNPSAQNPFSRLPLSHKDDEGNEYLGLIASTQDVGVFTREKFAQHFWRMLESSLGHWPNPVKTNGVLKDFNDATALISTLQTVPHEKTRAHLEMYQNLCGERTYPAPNDTALREHTRLSAALAYIVYANLLDRDDRDSDFLRWRIYRDQDLSSWWIDAEDEEHSLKEFAQQWAASPGAMRMVIAHLGCQSVRVCFTGLQDLFDNAVRLDDLTGVRELLKPDDEMRPSLKTAFKRHFALALLQLSCPNATLADVDDGLPGSTLADILPLSEGLFDAVYLIPACYPRDAIENAAMEAYHNAWDEIAAGRVIKVIRGDFKDFSKVLGLKEWEDEVKAQLARLSLSVAVRPVEKPELEGDDFRKWMADFGNNLLKVFKGIHHAVAVPRDQMSAWLAQAEKERKEGYETVCDVCGANPADPEFNRLVPVEPRLQIVVHRRGNEWERICRSCVGLRALAHGVRKAEPLERMIQPDGEDHIRVPVSDPEGAPKLPPGLPRGRFPLQKDEHKDMGVAFVRWRERGKSLDIFPTVSYAADNEGNVALLTLMVGDELFGQYTYEADPDLVAKWGGVNAENWHTYYHNVIGEAKKIIVEEARKKGECRIEEAQEEAERRAAGMLHVEPHIARVMTRIRLLDQFYTKLPSLLEQVPLRTLSLQAEYPMVRVLVPAAQVTETLTALEASLAGDLFSATWPQDDQQDLREEKRRKAIERDKSRELLSAVLPPLLLGAVVVFKEKQPLYLVLEAERLLRRRLAGADAAQLDGSGQRYVKTTGWTGLRLGLCDLRGTLAERGPWQGQVLWRDLGDTIELEDAVDRVTVLRKGVLSRDADLIPLAEALTYIRADRAGWKTEKKSRRELAEELCRESLFRPVLFLKHLTREGVR